MTTFRAGRSLVPIRVRLTTGGYASRNSLSSASTRARMLATPLATACSIAGPSCSAGMCSAAGAARAAAGGAAETSDTQRKVQARALTAPHCRRIVTRMRAPFALTADAMAPASRKFIVADDGRPEDQG